MVETATEALPLRLPLIARFGLNRAERAGQYVFKAACVAFLPIFLITVALQQLARWYLTYKGADPAAASPNLTNIEPSKLGPVFDSINLVILTPLLETVVLMIVIEILRRVIRKPEGVILTSALLWAVLHGALGHWAWGLLIFWAFVVFSTAYVVWSAKSRVKAFWTTAAIHMLNNVPGACAIVWLL